MLAPKPALKVPFGCVDIKLEALQHADASINQQMYLAVGGAWGWRDKAGWPLARWQAYVDGFGDADTLPDTPIERIETTVLWWRNEPAGYFELSFKGSDVEIRYFGLLPHAIGQKLGGALLSAAVEQAWQMGARRLWVHTCDLDHAAALPNYQRCGFQLYKTIAE